MHFIIGPERSAEALARKVGLRKEEWRWIGRLDDVRDRSFDNDRVLSTHDAWQLRDVVEINDYVESHSAVAA